ncbi:MAG: WecB/TagA/CpsF family glycosyltransferase [Allomuricauda sp.]
MRILEKITSQINFKAHGQTISYVNLYNYLILRKEPGLVERIDFFTFDGFLLKWFYGVFSGRFHKRMAPDFGSYFTELFDHINVNKESLYVIGARQNEISKFISILKSKYVDVKIVNYCNGFIDEEEEKKLLKNILELNPNKVLIGMGTPKQEELAVKIKTCGGKSTIFTCGAFIAQTANKGTNYYPEKINKYNLRWLYRIWKEPKLIKRYLLLYPLSICLFTFDFFKDKIISSG